ncbi:MAG: response regulator [Bryobacteraceae bacterium]
MEAEKKRILVVDDDDDYVASLSFFLEENGYQVLRGRDGKEGLQLASLHHPDLIVMDIMMDERTEGLFTVQELRRTAGLRNIPVFVVSALYTQVPEFQVAPDKSWIAHDEFLRKPVNPPELLALIRKRLGEVERKEARA